jgi:PP-loop superfamily ATP-utilizing enzyme
LCQSIYNSEYNFLPQGIKMEQFFARSFLDGSMLFNDIYRITNDTNFQFKILHHILPNNKLLHKMGIKNSALCNFCNQEEDSILHYLWGPRGKEILNFI